MFTNEEIEKMDYEQMAKRIVYQCDTPEELRAAIAKTLELVAVWADGNARKEAGDGHPGPINQSDDHYRSEVAATLLNEYHDVHQSSERLEAEIAKRLGYEFGRGYRQGVNQFQDACRILARTLVELKNGDTSQPLGDPTAEHFVAEAEKSRQVFLECMGVFTVRSPSNDHR